MDYEKPTIEDYGDLTEVTASLEDGEATDADFPQNTPKDQLTFS